MGWKFNPFSGLLDKVGGGGGAASGDITAVGDVASGAAFTGTQGTTLTFLKENDAHIKLDNSTTADTGGSYILINAANAKGTANAGGIEVYGGDADVDGNGGYIYLQGGLGAGGGVNAEVEIGSDIRTDEQIYAERLKSTGGAPSTSGTTKMVICDQNGKLSFTDFPDTGITSVGDAGGPSAFDGTDGTRLDFEPETTATLKVADSQTTDSNGGSIEVISGQANGTGNGGVASLSAGSGGDSGTGGRCIIGAGNGGSTSGNGGSVELYGGLAVDGDGGAIILTGADGTGTDKNGGSITLIPGAKTGSGTVGTCSVVGSFQCDSITNDTGLAHGVYTPTRSSETNLDSNVTMSEAQYMRVGNTVTVSGQFTADPTTPAAATNFEITLPISSNIGAIEDVSGVAFCGAIAGQGAAIRGVAANDTAEIFWVAGDVTSQVWSYTFTYQVI